MAIWTFFDYKSGMGNNQIGKWYDSLSAQEQSDFDEFLKILGKTKNWDKQDCKRLHSKQKGLAELRFSSCNKQHRVIGQFGPERYQFTLLLGCTHKQNIYDPPNAMDTALERKKALEKQTGSLVEHDQ